MDNSKHPAQNTQEVAVVATPVPYPPRIPSTRYGFEEHDEGDSGTALIEYWRILRRNAHTIFICSLASLVIGFAVSIPMKPKYRARTSLEVLTMNEDFMNMKQANPTTTNDGNYDTSEEQTQAKLLESSAVIDRAISKLDGRGPTEPITNRRIATSGWRGILHLSEEVPLSSREQLLSQAASTIKVRPINHTRILEVTIDSIDAHLAMDFANALTEAFMTQNLEARWDTTQRTSEWLRRELDDARDRLRHSEDALQAYARSSGLIFTDENTNVATEKLEQVQQALSAATNERIARQSRYELADHSPPDSLADVLNDSSLREMQSKISDVRRQIAQLGTVFNPEYSKIQQLRAELESLQYSLAQSRADILARIKNDFQESTRKESLLASAYDKQAADVTGQDEKAIQYNILKRDADSNRQLYDTMLQQMKQASIASAMRASNVRVVDRAKLPDASFSPNFKLNSCLAMMAGMLLSIVYVSVRERADRTLQQPGDARAWLELPELGTIPSASLETGGYFRTSDPVPADRRLGSEVGSEPNRNRIELITFQRKPSLVAEAFRSVLTSILFIGEDGSRPRVLVFTSANASDGKTTVTSNLAIAAAEIRCKVLVVDADLRRPRMHQIFSVPNGVGLSTLLGESNQAETDPDSAIQHTTMPNVDVLPSGPATTAAAHLLYSPRFPDLLQKFRTQYDIVLIDTPPLLQMTDARVVGRLADAVILVARARKTTRDALVAVKERLGEDRIRVMGTVLNDWNPKHSPGGYYGYYENRAYSGPRYYQ